MTAAPTMPVAPEGPKPPKAQKEKIYYPATAWYALAVQFFIIDRVLKQVALTQGPAPEAGLLDFTLFKNTGIAFSLPVPPALYWPFAVAVLVVLLTAFARNVTKNRVKAGMLFAVLLGAASNMYDRAVYGWVTDYILIFQRSAINLADVMIVVGLAALIWKQQRDGERKEAAMAAEQVAAQTQEAQEPPKQE